MGKANIALGAVALGLAAALAFLLNQLHAERTLIGTQGTRIEVLERNPVSAGAAQAALTQEAPVQATPSLANPSSASNSPDAASPGAAQLEAFKDPQYRASAIAQRKIGAQAQLRDLPYWMRISEQGLDGLARLLAGHAVEDEELHISTLDMRESGQARQQQESLRQRQDSEIAQLLGYLRFEEWKAYSDAAGARLYLSEMNEQLTAGDLLAPEQVRPIATAMTRAEQSMDEELRRLMASAGPQPAPSARMALAERRVELSHKQNGLMRAAAAQRLSAKQLAALDAVIHREQDDMKASLAMQRAELGGRW